MIVIRVFSIIVLRIRLAGLELLLRLRRGLVMVHVSIIVLRIRLTGLELLLRLWRVLIMVHVSTGVVVGRLLVLVVMRSGATIRTSWTSPLLVIRCFKLIFVVVSAA